MNQEDKIEQIDELPGSLKSEKSELQDDQTRASPNKEQFDALLKTEDKHPSNVSSDKVTLMDEVRNINQKVDIVSRASPTELVTQAHKVIAEIEQVKSKLATPDLELKGSVQNLLKNKLSHIDESLKIALNRAGLEYTPQPAALVNQTALASPIERFLGLLTHGQYQLQRLANDVQQMGNEGSHATPASMLAIQLKMGYVQQELELFANLLNKSLESIKTIMNVQV